MSLPNIVGFSAPRARSGKTTGADVLVDRFEYEKFSFARPLKTMFIALCMEAGVPHNLFPEILNGSLKESPLALVGGLSLRTFAEGVGTAWGRNMIDKNLWVNIARSKIRPRLEKGIRLVVDDLRFTNEADLIKELGGVVFNVERPSLPPREAFISEGQMLDYQFDGFFVNNGTLEEYKDSVAKCMLVYAR